MKTDDFDNYYNYCSKQYLRSNKINTNAGKKKTSVNLKNPGITILVLAVLTAFVVQTEFNVKTQNSNIVSKYNNYGKYFVSNGTNQVF